MAYKLLKHPKGPAVSTEAAKKSYLTATDLALDIQKTMPDGLYFAMNTTNNEVMLTRSAPDGVYFSDCGMCAPAKEGLHG